MYLFLLTPLLIAFYSLSINVCIEGNDQNIVSVRLNTCVINGKIKKSVDNRTVNSFKGIPYAEPPIGPLRFRKPQPLRQLPNTLDAFQWPNPCYQLNNSYSFLFFTTNYSEDCLYLNVMTPGNVLEQNKLLPVLFYIHGGSLTSGTSSWSLLDMRAFTTKANVVTVTINYR